MDQSKDTMTLAIVNKLQDMEPVLLRVGISPDHFMIHSWDHSDIVIEEAYVYIEELHNGAYRKYLKVRKLLSEEQWNWYTLTGDFEQHREMVLLKEVSKDLRKHITQHAKPKLFKKARHAKHKDKSGKQEVDSTKNQTPV
jgi:hypothetical protein